MEEILLLGARTVEAKMVQPEVSTCAVETRRKGKIMTHVQEEPNGGKGGGV